MNNNFRNKIFKLNKELDKILNEDVIKISDYADNKTAKGIEEFVNSLIEAGKISSPSNPYDYAADKASEMSKWNKEDWEKLYDKELDFNEVRKNQIAFEKLSKNLRNIARMYDKRDFDESKVSQILFKDIMILNEFNVDEDFNNKTGMLSYDMILSNKEYSQEKLWFGQKIQMSPSAYIEECAFGFSNNKLLNGKEEEPTTYSSLYLERSQDREEIDKLKELIKNNDMDVPVLHYMYKAYNKEYFTQEGLHRAIAAKELRYKMIPVYVFVSKAYDADKEIDEVFLKSQLATKVSSLNNRKSYVNERLETFNKITTSESVYEIASFLKRSRLILRGIYDPKKNLWAVMDASKGPHSDLFYELYEQGWYPELKTRDDLWNYFEKVKSFIWTPYENTGKIIGSDGWHHIIKGEKGSLILRAVNSSFETLIRLIKSETVKESRKDKSKTLDESGYNWNECKHKYEQIKRMFNINEEVKELDKTNEKEFVPVLNDNFKRWFADSKVVDENGLPLVVYHGSTVDIDEFDLNYSGDNTGNNVEKVFYFTSDKDTAITYSQEATVRNNEWRFYDEDTGFEDWDDYAEHLRDEVFKNPKINPCYLYIKNPYVYDAHYSKFDYKKNYTLCSILKGNSDIDYEYWDEEIAEELQDEFFEYDEDGEAIPLDIKYDGLIIKNVVDSISDWNQDYIDEYIVWDPYQIKSIYNKGIWSNASANVYENINEESKFEPSIYKYLKQEINKMSKEQWLQVLRENEVENIGDMYRLIARNSDTYLNANRIKTELEKWSDYYIWTDKIPVNKLIVADEDRVEKEVKNYDLIIDENTPPIVVLGDWEVLDGRHRTVLAKQQGKKYIHGYVPAELWYELEKVNE